MASHAAAAGAPSSPAATPPASPELGTKEEGAGPTLDPKPEREQPDGEQEDEPEHLVCPISRCMFRDPVFVPGSGNTYEREAIERFWALDKGTKRDPLTNTPLAKGERTLFTNWHVRREVAGFLERHPDLTPSGWPDGRHVPPPQPTTSVSNATEEVRTARERASAGERRRRRADAQDGLFWRGRAAGAQAGDRQLQSFLILASLLTVNVVVCVLSRRITSSGAALVGHPFSPLVHSRSSDPVASSTPTSAMGPASMLPPVCDAFLRTTAGPSVGGPVPLPEPSQYGSDRRLRVSYSRVGPKQYCLSPRRCTIHEDRNPRLRISIAPRYADWTTFVLLVWTCAWIAATTVWTGWSISVYWRWIPNRWRGDGEDLLLLPTAALSVLFTAPFWAVSATLLMQCAVASLAHTEMELSQTSWYLHSTMPGGWQLERAMGDVDDIAGLTAVDTVLWMPWPLGSGAADGAATTVTSDDQMGLGAMWQQTEQALLGGTAVQLSLSSLRPWSSFKGAPVGEHTVVHNHASDSDEATSPGGTASVDSGSGPSLSGSQSSASGRQHVDEHTDEQTSLHPTRHYEFGHGLSDEGMSDLVHAALTHLCRPQLLQQPMQ